MSGQTLRCFSDADIRSLLSSPLLLDGLSAEVLVEKGFGDFIGVKDAHWLDVEDSAYAYEQINEGDAEIYGVNNPRMTANRCSEQLYCMQPAANVEILSDFRGPDHKFICPGLTVHRNSLGGMIAAWAYPMDGRNQFFMAFFNTYRRILIQRLLARMSRQRAPLAFAAVDATNLYRAATDRGTFLAWINPTDDPDPLIDIRLPDSERITTVLRLDKKGVWQAAEFQTEQTDTGLALRIDRSVAALDAEYLLVKS